MNIDFVSVHPRFLESYSQFGVFKSAARNSLCSFSFVDLRQFAVDSHASVDASPYGGGDGMVLRPEPLRDAVNFIEPERTQRIVVVTGPSGIPFKQTDADKLLEGMRCGRRLILVCGRFAGFDQRWLDRYVDAEFSFGDVVISGGELPSLMIADATLRLIPGVLGNQESAACDSFGCGVDGGLEYPLYTRPATFEGIAVPEVLLSGDHARIREWRKAQAFEKTKRLRPDLLVKS